MARGKKYLSWNEVLVIAEDFMIKSGLRKFCTEICKGNCCHGCYDSPKACHKNEGRRLSCTLYLCGGFESTPCIDAFRVVNNARTMVNNRIHKTYIDLGLWVHKYELSGCYRTPNPYLDIPDERMVEAFKLPKREFMALDLPRHAADLAPHMKMISDGAKTITKSEKVKKCKSWTYSLNRFRIMFSEGIPYVFDMISHEVYHTT